jgi:hypothetical protein
MSAMQSGTRSFTPYGLADDAVALHNADESLSAAAVGWVAVWPGGDAEIVGLSEQTIAYGCDDTPTDLTVVDLTSKPDEGVVWLLPAGVRAQVHGFVQTETTAGDTRLLIGSDVRVSATVDTALAGTVTVTWPTGEGEILWSVPTLDGVDAELNLSNLQAVGVPTPELLVVLPETTLLVMRTYSYETVSFTVFELGGALVSRQQYSLFMCSM